MDNRTVIKNVLRTGRRTGMFFLCLFLLFTSVFSGVSAAETYGRDHDARPSKDGPLKVDGTTLVNAQGDPAVLRGVSTHGLTWYPDYVNETLFDEISENWGANIVRLAMYSEDYLTDPQENLEILKRGIEAAVKADMYVLVDWHILNDANPLQNKEAAAAFFDSIAAEYAGVPNILYEICNEPNGPTTWDDVYAYSEEIIPVIRSHSPDAVIIVGTPEYDTDLEDPLEKPLPFDNVMYCFHFYTSSHHDSMMEKLDNAVSAGLPVFITECGITVANGDGKIDYNYAVRWFDYLHDHDISYVIWSLSNKPESSAFFRASSGETEHPSDSDLTECGRWVKPLLQGTDPADIPQGAVLDHYSFIDRIRILFNSLSSKEAASVKHWWLIALANFILLGLGHCVRRSFRRRTRMENSTYDALMLNTGDPSLRADTSDSFLRQLLIQTFLYLSMIYLTWRIFYSISFKNGWLAVLSNVLLLITELIGFFESSIHYGNLMNAVSHPLPKIKDEEFPDVDIFIATYNEPEDLLQRTINGCKHLKYPNKDKVHIWVCDDNRRASMKALAESMGVGYFDRPDNKGAKAGNLNAALARTKAPYIVTLDADMIVRSDFLIATIPYFVYTEKCSKSLPDSEKRHLGLLQTPQCFYDPDVFQYALYSEANIPNEQDFFYRTIEVGKSSSNSVIYGGSNTILSRQALNDIGGFYEGSITEDFATGLLIEGKGYLSLALDTPYASGRAPNSFRDHIKQRTRWGRGVISTARNLHLLSRKDLSIMQKQSYFSSVIYWYSPLKNWIYVLSPLMYAVFMIPVFRCTWLDLLVYWLPMFILQDICLRVLGKNTISLKWSGIYETSVMPYLLMPVIKETFGISLGHFHVTDKSGRKQRSRKDDFPLMIPFLILIVLTLIGIVRVCLHLNVRSAVGVVIILFWLLRNLYSFILVLFLINGRDSDDDTESVQVKAGEPASMIRKSDQKIFEGITTLMTEHSISFFVDEPDTLKAGDIALITIDTGEYLATVKCVLTKVRRLRYSEQAVCTGEILSFEGNEDTYLEILYDRIPTLPQSLSRDFGFLRLIWRNLVYRLLRTV